MIMSALVPFKADRRTLRLVAVSSTLQLHPIARIAPRTIRQETVSQSKLIVRLSGYKQRGFMLLFISIYVLSALVIR